MSPPPDFFGANLAALEAREPALAALIAAWNAGGGPASGGNLGSFITASGEVAARLGGLLLHSTHDPRGEARRLLAATLGPGSDTILVLGTGLGYGIEAALATPGIERVLLCEAELGLLAQALALRDLRPILGDERLGFIVGGRPESVLLALEELRARSPALLGSRAAEAFSPVWYGGLRAAVERFSAKERINENTLRRFGRLWVRNFGKNVPRLAAFPGVERLGGSLVGFPALVLAAGPSLDELLPLLPALRERCLLIAVDTALRSLLSAGVEPDFLVVVDPQYWNWRHLAGLASPSSILVSEPAVYPPVLRFPVRATFLAASLFPLGRALGGDDRGLLGAGGSVATTAWDLARHLGSAPIYMGGLDFGFPRGMTHARASFFEQEALSRGERLRPAASAQAAALFGAPSRFLQDNEGKRLRSDARMTLYAWWFESRLARPEAPATLSLCPHGLAIPGMGPAIPEDLLSGPRRRPELAERLAEIAALPPDPKAGAALAEARDGLLGELRSLEALAERGVGLAGSARTRAAAGFDASDVCEELERLDRSLLESSAKDVAGFLLPPLGELFRERPRDLGESLLQSEALYRRLAESAAYHLALLEDPRSD